MIPGRSSRIPALIIAVVGLVTLTCLSCGRKSEPTLKAYVKPSPVREVRAVQREDVFVLTWTYPESEQLRIDGFRLERAQTEETDRGECGSFMEIVHVAAKQSHFADTNVRRGVSYCYRILVESKNGVISDPSPSLVASLRDVPSAPSELSYRVYPDAVEIEWQATSGVRYFVYRTVDKAERPVTPIHKAAISEARYRDRVRADRAVYYYVRPIVEAGISVEGPLSRALEIRPEMFVPTGPRGLEYVPLSGGVQLQWTENPETWITGYRVYRRMAAEPAFVAIGDTTVPAFRDNEPLSVSTRYYVTARGPVNESVPSSAVDAIPVGER